MTPPNWRDQAAACRHLRPRLVNATPGPGRGPCPASGVARHDWTRWAMHDALLADALDALPSGRLEAVQAAWPATWPSASSGHLSVRQMTWLRVCLIAGRPLDARAWFFDAPAGAELEEAGRAL